MKMVGAIIFISNNLSPMLCSLLYIETANDCVLTMNSGCTCKMSKLHLYSILPVFRAVKVPVTIENFCCILCQCQDVRNMFVPMIVKFVS